jgi:hypothetical protein
LKCRVGMSFIDRGFYHGSQPCHRGDLVLACKEPEIQ